MKIISRWEVGELPVYDIGLSKIHNYQLENGLVASNCFNKCLSERIEIKIKNGNKRINNLRPGESVYCRQKDNGHIVETKITTIHQNGVMPVFLVTMDDGSTLDGVTLDHKFICTDNKEYSLKEIFELQLEIITTM